MRTNTAAADYVPNIASHPVMATGGATADIALNGHGTYPTNLGYSYLAGAASGTYADTHTYYYALSQMLGTAP